MFNHIYITSHQCSMSAVQPAARLIHGFDAGLQALVGYRSVGWNPIEFECGVANASHEVGIKLTLAFHPVGVAHAADLQGDTHFHELRGEVRDRWNS